MFKIQNRYRILILGVLLLTKVTAFGQSLCEGNLGANNFEGGDFGSGEDNVIQIDPGIAPGYIYNNRPVSPDDGFYTITNSTARWGFKFPTWIDLEDNSSDPNGYMMVVNASFTPGLFYNQLVEGLCENTLYEFSADIINIVGASAPDHIEPNIDFLLDNIAQFSTGNVPQDEAWHSYGFTFTTDPGQTSIQLSLRNNAPGGNGNDLALDNISFRACGPDAFVNSEETLFLCENENSPVPIEAEIAVQNQALQWQTSQDSIIWNDIPSATSESLLHSQFGVGRYYYRYISAGSIVELLNEKCRIFSDVLTVEVLADTIRPVEIICEGESYLLGSQTLEESGNYMAALTSRRGCDSIVILDLTVLEPEPLDIDSLLIDPLCFGGTSGSISLDVEGINPPYQYSIDGVEVENPVFTNLSAGAYVITITNNLGCNQEISITLQDPEPFVISLPQDTIISLGESLDIKVESNEFIDDLSWLPQDFSPCGSCTEFAIIPISSGSFVATATNEVGCESSADINIRIDISDLDIYFPNVFDPSARGLDALYVIGSKRDLITNINEFIVFDRWGNIIHEVRNTTNPVLWDGKNKNRIVIPGLYTYLISLELIDGQEYQFAGDITVVR